MESLANKVTAEKLRQHAAWNHDMSTKTEVIFRTAVELTDQKLTNLGIQCERGEAMTKQFDLVFEKLKKCYELIESDTRLRKVLAFGGMALGALFLIYKFGWYRHLPYMAGKSIDILSSVVSNMPKPAASKVAEKASTFSDIKLGDLTDVKFSITS